MKKVKTKEEYAKILLDSKIDSKRDPRVEPGFTLLPAPPPWADDDHLWGHERRYNRRIEGWEKLCIEAYFSGWIDYFDEIVQGGAVEHTIYFQWTEEIPAKEEKTYEDAKKDEEAKKDRMRTLLRIYLNPGPKEAIAPAEPPILVEKPPPPPMS